MSRMPPRHAAAYDMDDEDEDTYEQADEEFSQRAGGNNEPTIRQRIMYRVLGTVGTVLDNVPSAFKYGWVPFVLTLGLSNIYCTSSTKAFAPFRDAFDAGMTAQQQQAQAAQAPMQ